DLGPSEGRATGPSQDAMAVSRAFRGHEDVVCGTAFAPGGARLVTVDIGGTVKHWDVAAREPRLAKRFGAAWWAGLCPSPDGSRLVFLRAAEFDPGQSLRITDGSGRTVVEAALTPGENRDACFSADGRTLAFLWGDEKTREFSVLVWDAVHGRELLR